MADRAARLEALVERHWSCNICGEIGVEKGETGHLYASYCCGSTRIREVLGQLLFSDEGGAWVRRKPLPA